MISINWGKIEDKLKKNLDENRYRHTLGVAYTACALAFSYGYDHEKARLSGLMHDCAKCIPKEKRIPLCEKYGIELTECEKKNTALIHSKLGVVIAKRDYGIEDTEILNAIRWHTTGKPSMSVLEKIIYIADYIEPNRDNSLVIKSSIRELAFKDLDKCCEAIMDEIIKYIKSTGALIDEKTLEAYNYYHKLNK